MIRRFSFLCLALSVLSTVSAEVIEFKTDLGRYIGWGVNEIPGGFGSFDWHSGDRFAGYWDDGSKEGYGAFFFVNGDIYVGDFADDWIAGDGMYIWHDSQVFWGDFRGGELWTGRRYDAQGKLLAIFEEGEFCDECFSNAQNYHESLPLDEGRYSGDTENGKPHGQGTWHHPENHSYLGGYLRGYRHGWGFYTYPDGTRYLGQWRDGSRTGFGVMLWADGTRYTGGFSGSKLHGQGRFKFPEGAVYLGGLQNDYFSGNGSMFYEDGGWFAGAFQEGNPWEGVAYNPDGTVAGTWDAGEWCAGCQPDQIDSAAGSTAAWCARHPGSFVCGEDTGPNLPANEIALGPLRLAFGSGGLDPQTFAGIAENVRVYEPGGDSECMVRHVFSRTRSGDGYPHIEQLHLEGIKCSNAVSIGTINLRDIAVQELAELMAKLEDESDIAKAGDLFGTLAIGTVEMRDLAIRDDEATLSLKELSLENLRGGVLGSVTMRDLGFKMFDDSLELTLDLAEGRNLNLGNQSFDWGLLRNTHLSFKGFSLDMPEVRITLAELGQPPMLLTATRFGYALVLDKLHLTRGEALDSEFNSAMDELGIEDLLINSRFSIDGYSAKGGPRTATIGFDFEIDRLAGLRVSIGLEIADDLGDRFVEIFENLLASQEGSEEHQQLALQALMQIGQQLVFLRAVIEIRDRGAVALTLDSAAQSRDIDRDLVEGELAAALDGFAGVAGWEVDVGSVIDQMLAGVGGVLRLTIKPKRHVPINSLFVEALGSADVTDFFDVTLGFVTDNAVATALPPISAPPRRELLATGSGFAVTRDGYLVTNQHVVDGCASVKVKNARGVHDVRVVTSDKHNDVALLQMAGKMRAAAYFRADRGVRTGDAVLAYGFPLQGLLSEEAKPTRGMINSLAGLDNDSRFMQISAPVHSGNSGGPLLDYSGNVIGIVTSKLDAIHMMEIHDEIPQNVNFALKSSLVRDFLDANRVNYDIRASTSPLDSATIITDANRYTYLVECWQ
jgi:S1-C subfamily serine protease